MNLSRSNRSLLAWVLYFSVLFSALACAVSHGQMTGLQLSGMDGGYCGLDASGSMDMGGVDSGVPMPFMGSVCPLCSTFVALALAAFFGLLGLLPRQRPATLRPSAEPGGAVRYLWPSANPRASPLVA